MGRHKVQEILKFLFEQGWIRYIDLPKTAGEFCGSIIEVLFRRLPQDEAGRKRKIRLGAGGEVRFFEQDGKTEIKEPQYLRTFITGDADPQCRYGEESDKSHWLPYPRRPGKRSPDERGAGTPDRCEQYNDHHYKDHDIESTPLIPRSKTGDQASAISREEMTQPETVASNDSVFTSESASGVSPSCPGNELRQLTADLVEFGAAAVDSPADRIRYEKFLMEKVFPKLKDPPAPSRWTSPATTEWLADSLKAHVLLAISSDEDWTVALLRSFGKRCGSYPKTDFCKILLAPSCWKHESRPTLCDLIQADTGRASLKGWEKFKEPLLQEVKDGSVEANAFLSNIRCAVGETDSDCARQWFEKADAPGAGFLMGDPPVEQVFKWLFVMWKTDQDGSLNGGVEAQIEEHRIGIIELLARYRPCLAVASVMHVDAKRIWGIDWDEIREEHKAWVECLNQRAEILELEPVSPLYHLIDEPLALEGMCGENVPVFPAATTVAQPAREMRGWPSGVTLGPSSAPNSHLGEVNPVSGNVPGSTNSCEKFGAEELKRLVAEARALQQSF